MIMCAIIVIIITSSTEKLFNPGLSPLHGLTLWNRATGRG
jgi:hypothetical protein